MEIPTAIRTLLIQVIALTVILAYGYTSAPVAQPSPAASQIGKVDVQDRGGSFPGLEVFEHNVLFPIRDDHKLFPRSGLHPACTFWHGQTVECLAYGVNLKAI